MNINPAPLLEFESNEEKDRNIAQVWSAQRQVFINALNPIREQGNVRLTHTNDIGILHPCTTDDRLDEQTTERCSKPSVSERGEPRLSDGLIGIRCGGRVTRNQWQAPQEALFPPCSVFFAATSFAM